MQIVADRFVHIRERWIDLASGHPVRIHLADAGARGAQIAWASQCGIQSTLRHPVLNALLDFGMLDVRRSFEAYEHRGPVCSDSGERWMRHAVRFCEAHGTTVDPARGGLVFRPLAAGPSAGTPIGVVLQPRAALSAIEDSIAATGPAGPCRVVIAGRRGSGLRTLALAAARAARLAGYVPVATSVLDALAGVAALLADRHVCLIEFGEAAMGIAAGALARLGGEGRRHMVLTFVRESPGDDPVLTLEPLGMRALTSMVFLEQGHPPDAATVLEAARASGGWPGHLLDHLGHAPEHPAAGHPAPEHPAPGHPAPEHPAPEHPAPSTPPHPDAPSRTLSHPTAVRETAPAFTAPRVPAGAEPHRQRRLRRTAAVLLSATRRAERLAGRGRHVHAARVLTRALRVLESRGLATQAAECALTLGRLALDRGRTDPALRAFEQARHLEPDGGLALRATLAMGEAWLAAARITEAEAAYRTALLSAAGMRDADAEAEAAAGLAECLCLQDRADEAAALPTLRARVGDRHESVYVALARVLLALATGDVPGGVRAGRDGLARATAARAPRLVARACRLLGLALQAAGDREQAHVHLAEGVAAARAARLPVEVLRLRCAGLPVAEPAARQRLVAHLGAASRGTVPRLVQIEMRVACARAQGGDVDPETRGWLEAHGIRGALLGPLSPSPVSVVERLLDLCRAAPDDRAAVEQLLADVGTRTRATSVLLVAGGPEARVVAQWGRAWPGEPHAAYRVIASGAGLRADARAEPRVAAEPIRYGGEVIASVACRWAPGVALDPDRVATQLRLAALAGAASVRGILDRGLVEAAAAVGGEVLGESPAARSLREAIARAARAPFPVLVEGESGSGKELVARGIHKLSPRRERRFCPLNCAALSDELIEAELFGHARGAFTGAIGERPGLFEEADGGTLFLDEIGELSPRAQAKLLRVLQDGEVRRVGENHARRVDVRVVAATNRRLAEEAAAGRFRADLRFRLDVVRIDVPPLRDRAGDVALLAARFWADATARVGARSTLSPEALAALARYDWPGNVRELQNVIAWMAVHSPARGRIGVSSVPAHVAQAGVSPGSTFEVARIEFERRFVRAALATANGHRTAAAAALGISRQGLAKMIKRLGIESRN